MHPMKINGTMMNSFLFNVAQILLCSVSVCVCVCLCVCMARGGAAGNGPVAQTNFMCQQPTPSAWLHG